MSYTIAITECPILNRRYLLTEWEIGLQCAILSLWKMARMTILASDLTHLQTL